MSGFVLLAAANCTSLHRTLLGRAHNETDAGFALFKQKYV